MAYRVTFDYLRRRLAYHIALWTFRKLGHAGGGMCSNRWWSTFKIGKCEVKLLLTDLSKPTCHSREELLLMLRQIRIEEAASGWKVPEPERCCIRDNDFDGNCSVHAAPGVLRQRNA